MAEIRVRITLTATTEEGLAQALQHAYAVGSYRLMRRVLVLLAVARGEAITQIAQLWGIARQSVYNWMVAFLAEGLESLPYKRPSGRPPKLTPKQRAELKEVLKAGPQAAGYRSACWTTVLIQQLISKRFGVLYSRQYLADLLHGLNFSYQKAKFVSDHLDERRRRRWMKKYWPRIWRKAKQRQALLLFGDEASFPQWGSLSYTWAPVGQQPLIKTSGKRKGYKVFGGIDFFTGKLFYQAITERFNAVTYQAFLLKVLADTHQRLILIQDGAKYHTSQAMREFFAAHRDRISVYQLPSYSPDYNPIEYLWKNIRRRATHNQYFDKFEALTISVDEALTYYAAHPDEVKQVMGVYCQAMTMGEPLPA
jgi:transposase